MKPETRTAATVTIHKAHQTLKINENPPVPPLAVDCRVPLCPLPFRRSASICGIEKRLKTQGSREKCRLFR